MISFARSEGERVTLKRLLRRFLAGVLRLLPLDSLLLLCQRAGSAVAGLVFLRDWRMQVHGWPQFFKHQINLSRWRFEPQRWAFIARGVYAREKMFRGCRVLDLCCGDGTYSRLFFSDIAAGIDAVDNDAHALSYARRFNAAPNVVYYKIDIVAQALPASGYDFVIWNAAICYFDVAQIGIILDKIVQAGAAGMTLVGMLPKANGYRDHKTEFADTEAVHQLLAARFGQVTVREVDEGSAITFYFSAALAGRAATPSNPQIQ